MNNKNLGKEVFDRTYDPNFINGWGVRPYSWSLGLSVQQEVAPRVSVNVGYFRNWWGNWYTVDNLANTIADWTQFSINAPVDPRLPGNGGQVINGLYDLNLNKVGQVNEWATNSDNYAKQIENWQGVDVGVVARLRNGLTVQGGTSTGRKLADSCALRALVPEQGQGSRGSTTSITGTAGSPTNPYCRQVEPYLTSIRGLATYTIPKIGLQVSGTLRNDPGDSLAANFVATNAYIAPERDPRTESVGRRQHHREPHRAEHVVFGSAQQHRPAHREDLPVRPDADAARRRRLQPDEHGRRDELQPDVLADDHHVADADRYSAGAVREDQRAVRFLDRLKAQGLWLMALSREP